MSNMKKILFVCYGGGHAQIIIPLVEKLKYSHNVSVLALTTAKNHFNGFGYNILTYENLSHLETEDFLTYGERFVEARKSNTYVSREESLAYYGINYLNLVRKFGRDIAEEKYALLGRQCFLPCDFLEKIFAYVKPDLVVSTSSPRTERAALEVAKEKNIKSVCIVDLFATYEKEWIKNKKYATKVCVLNDLVKSMLIREGRAEEDIVVTGNPAFDKLQDESLKCSAAKYKKQTFPAGKKILFWASQQPEQLVHPITGKQGGDPELAYKVERELIKFIDNNEDWLLVIRPHPSENRAPILNLKNVFWSSIEEKMTDILFSCDCLVTIASTIALEAHLINKPVITVDKSIFSADVPFSKMGISKGVECITLLQASITEVYRNHSSISESRTMSNATENVIDVINELLSL